MLEVRGYREFPVAVARWSRLAEEDYGRSIAMLVLPGVKQLNKMDRDFAVGVHKQVDPPLLAYDDDGVMSVVKAGAGKVTTGGLSEDGKPLVAPLNQPGRLDWANAYMEKKQKQINDAFMTTLYQILAEQQGRQQTAYEVSVREVEKASLLSPSTDNVNDEYFSALVRREIALADAAGDLEPMPEILAANRHKIKVTHAGELTVAQQAEKVLGVQRTLEVAPLFREQDPSAPKRVKWDKAMQVYAEGVGLAPDLLRTDAEMEEIREQDDQQAAAAAAAELAPGAGQAAKSFAEAEQIRATQAAGLGFLV